MRKSTVNPALYYQEFGSFGRYQEFIRPNYQSRRCFSAIPGTILQILTGESNGTVLPSYCLPASVLTSDTALKKVVFVFVDAFGWNLRERLNIPLIEEAIELGIVSKITSMFPSSTSAHIPTIFSGQEPCDHGIYEWTCYFKEVGAGVQTLPYLRVDQGKKTSMSIEDLPPATIFPQPTLFEKLAEKNVSSIVVQNESIINSIASIALTRGARPISYPDKDLSKLTEMWPEVIKDESWQFAYVYFPQVDQKSHLFGPSSNEVAETLIEVTNVILEMIKASEGSDTLFLISADHGQVDINPKEKSERVCVLDEFPQIEAMIKDNPFNMEFKIPPTGMPRNLFLSIKEEHARTVVDLLNRALSSQLEAFLTHSLFDDGIFGRSKSTKYIGRLGSVSIIPRGRNVIYLRSKEIENIDHRGGHGGAHHEEMIIPLISLRV